MKLKIFTGYAILILLMGFIVFLFRGERVKRDELERGMKDLGMMRDLTRKAYGCLLELASQGEVASIWNEGDLGEYREKRAKTCDALRELRRFVDAPEQKARIDSVCLLLGRKEILLSAAMRTFAELESISETVGAKVPAIVRQVRRQPVKNIPAPAVKGKDAGEEGAVEEPGKESFLKRIFGRKDKKSAYRKRQEQRLAAETAAPPSGAANGGNTTAVRLLHSLNREVAQRQEAQQKRLFAQMDSLHRSSRMLNTRLNGLVTDFERAAGDRLEKRYREIVSGREESYNAAMLLSLFVFVSAVILYTLVHRDVDRRYRRRQELERLNRKNRELLEGRDRMMLAVSHDLRAPLTAIRGYSDAMADECDREERSRFRDAVLQSSDNMLSMLNNLLLFYRLDMGKEQPNHVLFRAGVIASTLETAYRLQASDKGLHFTVECTGGDTVLLGDRERILQVGNNLLSNAMKFTPSGSVVLHVRYGEGVFGMEVSDTGTGIPEDRLGGIFQPFERLENAGTQDGYGLGLAVAREMVELLSGRIGVESVPGRGTTFRVSLPLPVADEESVRKRQASPVSLPENLYVAVVDNDSILLAMTVGMFSRHKIHCDGYHSARELLEAMRERTYDVLVTDIRMPGINGFELLELLRTSSVGALNAVPVIAVTARVEKHGEEFLKAGFCGYLYKPFSVSELFRAVRSCIKEGGRGDSLPKADFAPLLVGENDPRGMLELFIRETRKDLKAMEEYRCKGERGRLLALVHHLFPVWESIRIGAPLRELRSLLASPGKSTGDPTDAAIKNVISMGEHAIGQAEKMIGADSHE